MEMHEARELLMGLKDERFEVTVPPMLDAAITAMAERIGEGNGANLRSEAARQLIVAGVLATEGLFTEAQKIHDSPEAIARRAERAARRGRTAQ